MHGLLTNRDLTEDDALASQPTLSRLEISIGPRGLYRMGETLASMVVDRHRLRIGRTCRKVVVGSARSREQCGLAGLFCTGAGAGEQSSLVQALGIMFEMILLLSQ